LAVGGVDGNPEFWDLAAKKKAHDLKLPDSVLGQEITSIRFEPDNALQVAIGTERGKVLLYDMRYPVPVYQLQHHYKLPIHTIKFQSHSKKLLTADKKIVKIWNQKDGSLFTNIEPRSHINDVEVANDGSGMLFIPMEQEKIGTYFIPDMGNAPKWCAFLENMTEELEESKSTNLYDDYKFLTPADLDKLNASHLVGTNMLRAYMHGYFMEIRAYQKLLSVADPFAYEKYQK